MKCWGPLPPASPVYKQVLIESCSWTGSTCWIIDAREPKRTTNTSFEIQMKLFLSVGGRACTTCPCPTVKNISFVHEVLVLGVPFWVRARDHT